MIKRILIFAIFWNISYNADIARNNQNFLINLNENQKISLIKYSSFLNLKSSISVVAGISTRNNYDNAVTGIEVGIGSYGILTVGENILNIGSEYKEAREAYINTVPEADRTLTRINLDAAERTVSIGYLAGILNRR